MKKLRSFKELHWIEKASFVLFLSIGMLYNFGTYVSVAGRGLPAEADLNYSSGRVGSVAYVNTIRDKYYYLTLTDTASNKTTLFSCGYAAYSMFDSAKDCFQKERHGTHGVAGWYYAPDVLWFTNDMPQLVTLTVDGKEVWSYADALDDIESGNTTRIVLAILSSIFNFYFAVSPFFERGKNNPDSKED